MGIDIFKKCTAEFIGTFAIVFAGCGAILSSQLTKGTVTPLEIALTFGLTVMVMVYATGHISGAHLNPAVTLAFSLTRHFPKKEILPYITAQVLGGVTASILQLVAIYPILKKQVPCIAFQPGVTMPVDDQWMTSFVIEAVLTFVLMFVIMAVATDYRAVGNASGVAIGGTVMLNALFAGPLTGASMNPARSLGAKWRVNVKQPGKKCQDNKAEGDDPGKGGFV